MSTTATKRPLASALADAEAFRRIFPSAVYGRWEVAGSIRRGRSEVGDVEHLVIPRIGDLADPGDLFGETQPTNLLWHQLDAMVTVGHVQPHVYQTVRGPQHRWGELYRGVSFRGFNHEIWTASPQSWGSLLLIRTGPAEFSKAFVIALQARGYIHRDGFVRNKNLWTCSCGWRGVSPIWMPTAVKAPNVRTNPHGGDEAAHCPGCTSTATIEPAVVPCPDEKTAFALAGMPYLEPRERVAA
jgi:hypothetical protein